MSDTDTTTAKKEDKDPRFAASLPPLPGAYGENWRKAFRADASESPRAASYRAPGKEAIPFIQKSFRFSGGQSRDTAEYPFGGLWSNEYLNEKPQTLTVEGYLRGPAYIAQRNNLIEALRVPTDDDNPGYIDLPFWGRFPVVVGDNYEVSENADEQGQCALSIPFTRAGVSITERLEEPPSPGTQAEEAAANLEAAAVNDFRDKLAGDQADSLTLTAAFSRIKSAFLGALGRIQGAKTILDAVTGEVLGVFNFIDQAIRAPYELAQALFNAGASIFGGMMKIKNSAALYHDRGNGAASGAASGGSSRASASASGNPSLPPPDNEKNILLLFLSAASYTLPIETVTVSQRAAKTAVENLYRTLAFWMSARIIANKDFLTRREAAGYWRLIEKLEESIDRENPAVYAALRDLRTALSRELSGRELNAEMTRNIPAAAPLLYLAYYLGCDEDKIRKLNTIADSFVVEGGVIYV
jgi:hypothetical protein